MGGALIFQEICIQKKPSGINIQWWANVGNNTTDAIYFIWNKNENRFRINRIDPSNY